MAMIAVQCPAAGRLSVNQNNKEKKLWMMLML